MKKIEELGISPGEWNNDGGGIVSREVTGDDGDKNYFELCDCWGPCSENDAHLIAAAPELYKWLAFAVEQYKCEKRSCNNCPNGKCWVVDATSALAKASGESEAK